MTHTLVDPRLHEIRFLAELERQGITEILPWKLAEDYGVSEPFIRSMALQLMADECLIGKRPPGTTMASLNSPRGQTPREQVWDLLSVPVQQANLGNPFAVDIGHQGRLRLWRLRDEMNRRRIRDPFDILIDGRHFNDDLRIRGWMLPDGEPLTLVMADLDHFKKVNDTLGHPTGDEYLRRYLALVREVSTAFDGEAYRFGGDETLSIFPSVKPARALLAAERLRASVEAEFKDSPLPNAPTSSVGVVTFSKPPQNAKVAKEAVDKRLYEAKAKGRNCVVSAAEP